ncbi:galactofuranosylgalactofuranosylrhamnosyl-N-acetylglucosaminyl-diphospho-decaprenol beta-1,5/1,6-galactofuranosyltransferase [Thermomonospora echinospora]|uniref:Galactofuranosylgalactofuranosylrhamnosyl-N-acetylglucosaminyl-diphospho-decaprenol beta-1,5/1,6-galactofuranosyltransferase n=1 Tax=Thermomonospora echinospora TaxID=1992 RepID=A0A1H6D435_9ACTN|nr:glycosyltransferase [Thermomonospora echinospora]SEG79553.1 galactofuranosylgalactofuranosylrhamnosyl-N-acetylglucosaminyl-diphospho-decaprenol beta-1,5/1,6-galactofuranosyltransferase [Thermomonospora echinospora]
MSEHMRVLQRIVMPLDRDLDVVRLYLDDRIGKGRDIPEPTGKNAPAAEDDGGGHEPLLSIDADTMTRRGVTVPIGRRLSLCTYFNAFPAGYWRRWSVLEEVRLRVRVRGEGTVIVYRSNAKGHVQRVTSAHVDSTEDSEHRFKLSLKPFIDGGWYWFDLVAGQRPVELVEAEWLTTEAEDRRQGRTNIGITTFNRPGFCVDQLVALGQNADVLEAVEEILIVDQGTQRVADHPGFAEAAQALGDKLRMIEQPNLGGSGGFARAMEETARGERADYVLLLDDDVITEPEGILRAVAFADLARTPTIVGGHMFSLYDRSVLHAYGETLEQYRWFWGPAPNTKHGHDFAARGLRQTPWLHRRIDVDYNGWWMCLIPTEVIRKIGLSLPMFIKWDDAEYGIRAGKAGFPTVSLPGVAVWHVPWHEKDDTIDWQAYFHERNRLVSALIHSPYERGGNLLKESLFVSVKHALAMQYSAAELMLMAMEDVLRGPEHMHPQLPTKLPEIRAFRSRFNDAQSVPRMEDLPPVRRTKPPRKGRQAARPRNRAAMITKAAVSGLKQFRPVDRGAYGNPQAVVPHVDLAWWRLADLDSALVSAADGTGVFWYQRDRREFRALMQRTSALHARLLKEWPELSRRYREAAPEIAAAESWWDTFQAAPEPEQR